MLQSRSFQEAPAFLQGIGGLDRLQKTPLCFRVLPEKGFPEKIINSDEDERSIPMKINYNKCSLLLQGSSHLIEKVNRTI
jgi:hypothetical protein